MQHLLQMCKKIKDQYGDFIKLMTGNIANPDSIGEYIDAKIDYVRVGIGTGAGCTTSSNTAIHYPQASLLNDINESYSKNKKIKIIADGGIQQVNAIKNALKEINLDLIIPVIGLAKNNKHQTDKIIINEEIKLLNERKERELKDKVERRKQKDEQRKQETG